MKPAPFDYMRPETVEETLDLLSEHGSDAVLLAGGMTLGPMLNLRLVRPAIVIDIGRIAGLAGAEGTVSGVKTGAGLRQRDAFDSRTVAEAVPLLRLALPWVGHVQTRNRGTLGGSVAHADPSAEIPLCLATLNGRVVLRSKRRTRSVPARDFFLGMLMTVRAPDEMIVSLKWPRDSAGEGYAFEEIAQRHGDFAIAAVACRARLADGKLAELAIGLGGVEDRPLALDLTDFAGSAADERLAEAVSETVAKRVTPLSDHAASSAQRRSLVRALARRTVAAAVNQVRETAA